MPELRNCIASRYASTASRIGWRWPVMSITGWREAVAAMTSTLPTCNRYARAVTQPRRRGAVRLALSSQRGQGVAATPMATRSTRRILMQVPCQHKKISHS
jgi:hypothetical protein